LRAFSPIELILKEVDELNKSKFFLFIVFLIVVIVLSCAFSEVSWSIKSESPDALRKLVGLPSLAVGDLNPAARNPALEQLCTSFFDVPGGNCIYYTQGIEKTNLTLACNVTEVAK
jgi:p-aminobenzoyl-glutamate transporter AbgT